VDRDVVNLRLNPLYSLNYLKFSFKGSYFPFFIHSLLKKYPTLYCITVFTMSVPKPDIALYFLQASRSIRIAGLLEGLGLGYKSVFFPRINNKAPADFKERCGNELGKAPFFGGG